MFKKKKIRNECTGLKIQTYLYMCIHTLYRLGISSQGIPHEWTVRSFLIFNPIFIGTVGIISVDTEIKVNNIIFGNIEINL